MAVALVGTGTFIKSTVNGSSCVLTFSTGGAASGDLVIANWTYSRAGLTANLTSSAGTAYTQIGSRIANGNLQSECWYRILTSSETTVSSCATGSAQDSVVLSAIVLRSFDVTGSTLKQNSTTGTSSNPNSPSVTVDFPNSGVITIASILANTTLTAPSGFGSAVSTGATDTRSVAGGLAYLSTNQGTIDPSSWAGGASAAWVAWTLTVSSTEPLPFTWLDMASQSTHNPPACLWGGRPDVVGY